MKRFLVLAALAYETLCQQITFTNTPIVGSVAVGSAWNISWSNGNGQPVSLAFGNTTWSFPIFTQVPATPSTYSWTVPMPVGLVSGNYQLSLTQLNADGTVFSPFFNIVVPATNMGPPTISTVTVEYVFWDHACGCSKTTTAASPLNTGAAATTYTWYESHCSCTKSAVVPVPTMSIAATNYTAPANPPVPSNTASASNIPAGTTAAKTAGTTPFTGDANKKGSSFFGLVALVAVAVLS